MYYSPYMGELTNEYTYDESGNLIKDFYTNSDDENSVREYTYDENGNLIKEVRSSNAFTGFNGI